MKSEAHIAWKSPAQYKELFKLKMHQLKLQHQNEMKWNQNTTRKKLLEFHESDVIITMALHCSNGSYMRHIRKCCAMPEQERMEKKANENVDERK